MASLHFLKRQARPLSHSSFITLFEEGNEEPLYHGNFIILPEVCNFDFRPWWLTYNLKLTKFVSYFRQIGFLYVQSLLPKIESRVIDQKYCWKWLYASIISLIHINSQPILICTYVWCATTGTTPGTGWKHGYVKSSFLIIVLRNKAIHLCSSLFSGTWTTDCFVTITCLKIC